MSSGETKLEKNENVIQLNFLMQERSFEGHLLLANFSAKKRFSNHHMDEYISWMRDSTEEKILGGLLNEKVIGMLVGNLLGKTLKKYPDFDFKTLKIPKLLAQHKKY